MTALDPAHLVGIGGALGAVLRHVVAERVAVSWFPTGTLAVNVLGSALLGLVAFGPVDRTGTLLVGAGVAGAVTTFSSFAFETVQLWETGSPTRAAANAVLTLAGALTGLGVAGAAVAIA